MAWQAGRPARPPGPPQLPAGSLAGLLAVPAVEVPLGAHQRLPPAALVLRALASPAAARPQAWVQRSRPAEILAVRALALRVPRRNPAAAPGPEPEARSEATVRWSAHGLGKALEDDAAEFRYAPWAVDCPE